MGRSGLGTAGMETLALEEGETHRTVTYINVPTTRASHHAHPHLDPHRPPPLVHQGGRGSRAVLHPHIPEIAHRPRVVAQRRCRRMRRVPVVWPAVLRDECR